MISLESSEIKFQSSGVSLLKQLLFYLPLALTSLLMMTTHSLFNAALSRLSTPEVYLSAFAVAKALIHLFESPTMMVRQTVSTLVNDKISYNKIRKFVLIITGLVFALIVLLITTGAVEWIFKNIMGIEGQILNKAVITFSVLVFLPFASSMRNFMQGIAASLNKTYLFTIGTIVRIIFVLLLVIYIDNFSFIPGAVFAGFMFFGAILIEGLTLLIGIYFTTSTIPQSLVQQDIETEIKSSNINLSFILVFYGPLMITTLLKTLGGPIINFGLARSITPEVAISVFAVAWGLGTIFLSPVFMFHQLVINFINSQNNNINSVKKFGFYLGIFVTIMMVVLGYTDLGYYILSNWIKAPAEITVLSIELLKIMVVLPVIMLGREFYWGLLMKKNSTKYIGKGKIVNLTSLILTIIVLLFIAPVNSGFIGVLAIIISQFMELIYLFFAVRKSGLLNASGGKVISN